MLLAKPSFQIDSPVRRLILESPIKLRHVWIPLSVLVYVLFRSQHIAELSASEAGIGLGITFLSVVPLFVWASRARREVPAFQCFCMVHFPYFAYPILCCKPEYMQYPEEDRLTAGLCVIVYLSLAIFVYHIGAKNWWNSSPSTLIASREIPERKARTIFTLLLLMWLVFLIARCFGFLRAVSIMNIITSASVGGGTVALWYLARQIGEGKLTTGHTLLIGVIMFLGLGISFATASLIGGLITCVVGVVAYTLGRRKIPWVVIVCTLLLVSFLNLGKGDVRRAFWRGGVSPYLSISLILDIYEYWVPASFRLLTEHERRDKEERSLLDRANLIQMQALVVSLTPKQVPYMYGETYSHIATCLVPRIFWPTKPHGHISTEVMGLRYGITNPGNARKTTIAIGAVSEAWANFGWLGILGLGTFYGSTMRFVAKACIKARPYSVHAILGVVWVSQSFQIEQALSSWIASLLQAVVAVIMLLYPFSTQILDRSKTRADYTSW